MNSLPQKHKASPNRIIATNANSGSRKLKADLDEYAWPLIDNALSAPFAFILGRFRPAVTFGVLAFFVLIGYLKWKLVVDPAQIEMWQKFLQWVIGSLFSLFQIITTTHTWSAPVLIALASLPLIILVRWAKPFEPSFITLEQDGICCHWQIWWFRASKKLKWMDITDVTLIRPSAKTAPENWSVFFRSDKRFGSIKIRLTGLSDFRDRQKILEALDQWAPEARRDPELLQAFTPAAKGSYTDLWLQSLSSPPRRDRLKPLTSGVKLQNGKYKLQDQLGAGGQGIAYLASVQDASNSNVVLKESILPIYLDIDVRKAALERFASEAEMLRQLNHQQIVKLIDFFVEDHRGYLVLEHINGLSLRKLVDNNGHISESRVIELAKQMCTILGYLHNQTPPIVHRDFTPDNLILSEDNILKLIDFTVADRSNRMKTATIVGKPAYMPPEQLRGKPGPQSDVYAMGATIFFLLTGENPEPITSSRPNDHSASVTEKLNKLIAKATALKIEDRFQSTDEFLNELNGLSL